MDEREYGILSLLYIIQRKAQNSLYIQNWVVLNTVFSLLSVVGKEPPLMVQFGPSPLRWPKTGWKLHIFN